MLKIAVVSALAVAGVGASAPPPDKPVQLAQNTLCFKTGEETMTGQNTKICYYDCLGNRVAITVKSYELCPLNIRR